MSDTAAPAVAESDDLFEDLDTATDEPVADQVETTVTVHEGAESEAKPEVAEEEDTLSAKILALVTLHAPTLVAQQHLEDEFGDKDPLAFEIFDVLDELVSGGELVCVEGKGIEAYGLPPGEQPKATEEQPLPAGTNGKAMTRARALDKEISSVDIRIVCLKQDLKEEKEEREQLVTALRKCIRESNQGELPFEAAEEGQACARCNEASDALSAARPGEFENKLVCPDCLRTLTELAEEEERGEEESDGSPESQTVPDEDLGFTLDDLSYTRKTVREHLDELVKLHGLGTVLWTIKPDLPIEKVSQPKVNGWEETLNAVKDEPEEG